MKTTFALIIASFVAAFALSTTSHGQVQKSRPKTPHSHHTDHAGQVMMFGDDHIEVVGSGRGEQAMLYISDKFRAPVPLSELQITVEVIDGNERVPLKITASAKANNVGLILVPVAMQKSGLLQIKAKRLHPPKGHLNIDAAQTLALNKVFKP